MIQKHFDKILLGLAALGLFATAALIFLKAQDFEEAFTTIRSGAPENDSVEPLDLSTIQASASALNEPKLWEKRGAVFNSTPYIVVDGVLVDPVDDDAIALHPPVPNRWFLDNELDILDPGITRIDSDGDGFTNFDEWRADVDPNDPKAHPPYYSKLRLEAFETIPFRLRFNAYTGDTFQINTIDLNQPSQFRRVGEDIAGTRFRVESFEEKFRENPSTGAMEDISELTIIHVDTDEKLVMILEQVADSPDSFAVFRYLWNNTSLKVKKDQTFTLEPDTETVFALESVNASGAVIQIQGSTENINIPTIEAAPPN